MPDEASVPSRATEPGTTLAEKLGASAGLWAVLWLMLQYLILREAAADPVLPTDEYVSALLNERMHWEWATALRLMGGIMIIWFMGSLSGRLRLIEGEPGRLASIAFGIGAVWGTVWIFSAMFNSLGLLAATLYDNPEGARLLGVLGREAPLVLTPSIVFTLALATSFVALRYGGFPAAYTLATVALTALFLALALMDWYGTGNLAPLIMLMALGWLAVTSALVVPAYRPPDLVRGRR